MDCRQHEERLENNFSSSTINIPLPQHWIQTLNGKAFLVAIRLYGSSTEFYDQTWKPDDVLKVNTESTYDWHNDQWTVPINFLVSQLTRIGKLPVQFGVGAKVYAEGPSGAPEWGIRFVVTPLFPTGGKHPPTHQPSYAK
jgi:hypothetical protein